MTSLGWAWADVWPFRLETTSPEIEMDGMTATAVQYVRVTGPAVPLRGVLQSLVAAEAKQALDRTLRSATRNMVGVSLDSGPSAPA